MTNVSGLSDGTYTAVVDSTEDGLATVFLEEDGSDVADAVIDASMLPDEGRHADAIFTVTVTDGGLGEWQYQPETTADRQEAAQDRFDRLSKRPPSDDDP